MEEAVDRERWRAVVGAAKSRLGHKWPWECVYGTNIMLVNIGFMVS